MGQKEVFIPTYEVTLWKRNMLGEPMSGKSTYQSTSPAKLASMLDMHRRKNPLGKRDRRKQEERNV